MDKINSEAFIWNSYAGTFDKVGIHRVRGTQRYYPIFRLRNVINSHHELLINKYWLVYSDAFLNLGELQQGDQIKFTAKLLPDRLGLKYDYNHFEQYTFQKIEHPHLLNNKEKKRKPMPHDFRTLIGYCMVKTSNFQVKRGAFTDAYVEWAKDLEHKIGLRKLANF